MLTKKAVVKCKVGIHARPASMLVKLSDKYKSKIEIEFNGRTVRTTSIIGLLGLGAKCDDEIVIRADGDDEINAVDAVIELLKQSEI